MQAVIMAGGKGTRLRTVAEDIPKPMFPVHGKPVLEYQIESLVKSGVKEITLVVGPLKESIINYFGNGERLGAAIRYIVEKDPLGTAGALYFLKEIGDDFVLLFGDLMLDIDFKRFMSFHKSRKATMTLYGHPNSHPYDSDLLVVDPPDRVVQILSKADERPFHFHNFVNAGVYCISPAALRHIHEPVKMDLEKGLLPILMEEGRVFAYRCTEYVKDMGTPDRLESVSADIGRGIVTSRSLKHRQKAIFLDRDGTINEYVGFLQEPEQLQILSGAAQAIATINSSPYLAIVTTNQPVIARGEVSFRRLDEIHKKLETELGQEGAYLDDLFFCPHHPDSGFPGERTEFKIDCDCRKPKVGMLLQASKKYNIDLSQSWYVGDTTVDVQTGKNAGMKSILLETGEAGTDAKYHTLPDYKARDLMDAVEYIMAQSEA